MKTVFIISLVVFCSLNILDLSAQTERIKSNLVYDLKLDTVRKVDTKEFLKMYVSNSIFSYEAWNGEMNFVKIDETKDILFYGYKIKKGYSNIVGIDKQLLNGIDLAKIHNANIGNFVIQKIPNRIKRRIARNSKFPTRIEKIGIWDIVYDADNDALAVTMDLKISYSFYLRSIHVLSGGLYTIGISKFK